MPNRMEFAEVEQHHSTDEIIDDLVLISNRQPYRHKYVDETNEDVTIDTPAGGLVSGIDPVMQRSKGTWIAWGDGDADFAMADTDGRVQVPPSNPSYTLQRVQLSADQISGYYDGYANQGLWPLCHSMTGKATFDRDQWKHYRDVNDQFADAIDTHLDDETTVWFHDYHFTVAPKFVRAMEPDVFQMHFFHIPWPAPDVFRICPQGEAILEGLLANDFVGFHCPRFSAQFLRCVDQMLEDPVIDWSEQVVSHQDRMTRVAAVPLGVDADRIRRKATDTAGDFWDRFCSRHGIDPRTNVALGVDRLDYTKGLLQRMDAFEHLFETRPELRGELTYIQKGCGTRERIPAYQRLRDQVENRIRSLNKRFATGDWSPVVYTTDMFDREDLIALYRHSDMAVVGSLRDGMNLVAKEYVASQIDNDGIVLLSPFAGAFDQLGHGAVEFDPYDTTDGAEAIERASSMGRVERANRMAELREQVHETDLSWWLEEILATADKAKHRRKIRNDRFR